MIEVTQEDLDYVHKLILECDKRKLLSEEQVEDCIEVLNHISWAHNFLNFCECDIEFVFWKLKDKLESLIKDEK